jgi:hypothetical protein
MGSTFKLTKTNIHYPTHLGKNNVFSFTKSHLIFNIYILFKSILLNFMRRISYPTRLKIFLFFYDHSIY